MTTDPPRSRLFANYPTAQEGPQVEYKPRVDNNPALRGLSLSIATSIIERIPFIQRYLWQNAGLGNIKDIPELGALRSRFDPSVVPLWDGNSPRDIVPLDSPHLPPPPTNVPYRTVADFHAAYRSGTVTPLQVAEALLSLSKRDKNNRYKTVFVDDHGLGDEIVLAAAKASTRRWAGGRPLGILDGVPFAAKDDTPVRGFITHYGMKYDARQKCFEPATDTRWPVKKLEEAGAVMIGKVNMHELGCDTNGCNPVWGTPPNWHNNSYYPGGSSSGSASSCSAGLFPFTVGGDAGGSLRIPAAFNGLYTIKPTHHRQVVLPSSMAASGPLASSSRDLTIAYRVMSQPNPDDPIQGAFAPSVPPPAPAAGQKRYLGVYRAWWERSDPRVAAACDRAVDWLVREKGYEVVPIYIPYVAIGQSAHGGTCLAEMADAARSRANHPGEWLGLVNPATKLYLMVGSQTPALDYLKYNALRELLMQHMAFLFARYPGLVIVTPTTPVIGWARTAGDETHGLSDGNMSLRSMTYIWLANTTGCPSVSAPVAYVDPELGEGRLPVGLMATGEWGAEEQLLGFTAEAEEYLHGGGVEGGRVRPDGWVDVLDLAKKGTEAEKEGR